MAWVGTKTGCLLVCAIAIGCGGDDADDGATSVADDSTSADDDDGPTSADATNVTEASATDDDTSVDDSITDTEPSTSGSDSVSSDGTEAAESTTGDELYCGLEDLEGGPWFELGHAGVPLAEGSIVTLECGGQGSLMFFIETRIGGWMPEEDSVFFSVTVVVDNFVGPSGYFYQDTMFGEYIGCEEFDGGGPPQGITIIPPDGIDITALDGRPAMIHVELLVDGNPSFDATVELAVPDDAGIMKCGQFG
jgi:hypothetical protein